MKKNGNLTQSSLLKIIEKIPSVMNIILNDIDLYMKKFPMFRDEKIYLKLFNIENGIYGSRPAVSIKLILENKKIKRLFNKDFISKIEKDSIKHYFIQRYFAYLSESKNIDLENEKKSYYFTS